MDSDCSVVEPPSTSLEPIPASCPGLTPVTNAKSPSLGVWSSSGAQMLEASPGVPKEPTGMVDSHCPVVALSWDNPSCQKPKFGVVVLVVNQDGLKSHNQVEWQIWICSIVRAVRSNGAGGAERIKNAKVVFDHCSCRLRRDGRCEHIASRILHGQRSPWF